MCVFGLMRVSAMTLAVLGFAPSAAAHDEDGPTCDDAPIGVDVHGQHVVRDYVVGSGLGGEWPPEGGSVGRIVGANRGAAVPGGPGPGYHFPEGIAPGASFCTDSQSGGFHF